MVNALVPESIKPPYATWSTVRNCLQNWKDSVPPRIERPMLSRMSNGDSSAFMQAVRFLQLTEDDGKVTTAGKALISSFGTDALPSTLKRVLDQAYSKVLGDFNTENGTPGILKEKFKAVGVHDGQMMDKTCRFYLKAAEDAGQTISQWFKEMPGSRAGTRPARKPSGATGGGSGTGTAAGAMREDPPIPDDYLMQPIFFKGRQPGQVVFPADLGENDIPMIEAALGFVKAYAAALKGDE